MVGICQADAAHLDEQEVGDAVNEILNPLRGGMEGRVYRPDADGDDERHQVLGEDGTVFAGEEAQILLRGWGVSLLAGDGACHQRAGEDEEKFHPDGTVGKERETHAMLQRSLAQKVLLLVKEQDDEAEQETEQLDASVFLGTGGR